MFPPESSSPNPRSGRSEPTLSKGVPVSKRITTLLLAAALTLALAACGQAVASDSTGEPSGGELTLVLAAYTTPREAFAEIIPLFQAQWLEQTGQTVTFEESYQGSGAQSRAVVEGFEADIVALSLEADVIRIQEAGLLTHDWKAVGAEGVEVLTPNPATSGGAMWNVLALYGAALRGQVEGVPEEDPQAAFEFLKAVLGNVLVMD